MSEISIRPRTRPVPGDPEHASTRLLGRQAAGNPGRYTRSRAASDSDGESADSQKAVADRWSTLFPREPRGEASLEEKEYPPYYHIQQQEGARVEVDGYEPASGALVSSGEQQLSSKAELPLFQGHREFQENQQGVSYEALLVPYLRGATQITITDSIYPDFPSSAQPHGLDRSTCCHERSGGGTQP
jgi:hypothetical protein